MLFDFTFVPGGRVMHGAGREDARRRPTLSNCYVIPIEEDSLEGIYRCLSESAMVYRTGGGVGTDLSAFDLIVPEIDSVYSDRWPFAGHLRQIRCRRAGGSSVSFRMNERSCFVLP